jgi:hypothetical protein
VSIENRPLDVVEGKLEDSLPIVIDCIKCHFFAKCVVKPQKILLRKSKQGDIDKKSNNRAFR